MSNETQQAQELMGGTVRITTKEDVDINRSVLPTNTPTYKWVNGVSRMSEGEGFSQLDTQVADTNNLRPTSGIASTALSPSGSSNVDMGDPETTIEIGGIRAALSIWEKQGYVELGANGKYQAVGQESNPTLSNEEENPSVELSPLEAEVETFHPEMEKEYEDIIEPWHQQAWESSVEQVAAAMLSKDGGDINIEALAKASNTNIDETYIGMQKALLMHQAKARVDLEKIGIPQAEFQKVVSWARANQPQLLYKSVKDALLNRSSASIRALGKAYLSKTN